MKLSSISLILACWFLNICRAATVTGNLNDISLNALNTKLLFTPTNEILINATGLSAGGAKVIETTAGAFSIPLDAGDYTVSLPLIPARHPFRISVMDSTSTINITNLMQAPITYTYTNQLGSAPVHVNLARVIVASTAGETTLLDSAAPARFLTAGSIFTIDAYGFFTDPITSIPAATFRVKLGATTLLSFSSSVSSVNWHLHCMVTVRSAGISGSAVANASLSHDTSGGDPFFSGTQTATINTTVTQSINVTGEITDFTGTENITCDQLVITML